MHFPKYQNFHKYNRKFVSARWDVQGINQSNDVKGVQKHFVEEPHEFSEQEQKVGVVIFKLHV